MKKKILITIAIILIALTISAVIYGDFYNKLIDKRTEEHVTQEVDKFEPQIYYTRIIDSKELTGLDDTEIYKLNGELEPVRLVKYSNVIILGNGYISYSACFINNKVEECGILNDQNLLVIENLDTKKQIVKKIDQPYNIISSSSDGRYLLRGNEKMQSTYEFSIFEVNYEKETIDEIFHTETNRQKYKWIDNKSFLFETATGGELGQSYNQYKLHLFDLETKEDKTLGSFDIANEYYVNNKPYCRYVKQQQIDETVYMATKKGDGLLISIINNENLQTLNKTISDCIENIIENTMQLNGHSNRKVESLIPYKNEYRYYLVKTSWNEIVLFDTNNPNEYKILDRVELEEGEMFYPQIDIFWY